MNRVEKSRHLECLEADIAVTEQELASLRHERDVAAAWVEGWDARERPSAKSLPVPGADAEPDITICAASQATPAATDAAGEGGRTAGLIPATGAEPTARDVLGILDDTPQSIPDLAKHFGSTVPVVTRLLTGLARSEDAVFAGRGWTRKPEPQAEAAQ